MILYIKEPYLEINVLNYNIIEELDTCRTFGEFLTQSIRIKKISLEIKTDSNILPIVIKTEMNLNNINFYGSFIESFEYIDDGINHLSISCDYFEYNKPPTWLLFSRRERIIDKLLND